MKLLYTVVVLLGLIQWSSSATPFSNQAPPGAQYLLQFYEKELNNVYKVFSAPIKTLLEKCLQDDLIKQASTPTDRKFKQAITDYLNKYPTYTREGRYTELMNIFNSVPLEITFPSLNKNTNHIFQLFSKYGYGPMFQEHQKRYVSMANEKFIPKFEDYQKHLSPDEVKQQHNLIKWFQDMKKCQAFECYHYYLDDKFPRIVKGNS